MWAGGREGGRKSRSRRGESGEERGTNLRPVARKLDSAREVSRDLGNPSLPIGDATCAGVQRAGGNVWKPRIRGDTTRPRRRWRWRPTRAPRERHYSQLCQARRSSRTLFNRSRLRVTLSRTHTPPHTHTPTHTFSFSLSLENLPSPSVQVAANRSPSQRDTSHTRAHRQTHTRARPISLISPCLQQKVYTRNIRPSYKSPPVRLRLSTYCVVRVAVCAPPSLQLSTSVPT